MPLSDTWQQADAVAAALLDRLRPAYIPGQLELFSSRNQDAVERANAPKEAPPVLHRARSRCEIPDEEEFIGVSYGGTCTNCDD